MMDFSDKAAIERAAEFTFTEQGLWGVGPMAPLEGYTLGFVAGMRLAGEEILKRARDKAWQRIPLAALEGRLDAPRREAIAQALQALQAAGFADVHLEARGEELRIGLG
ncbi:hypothetical protein J7643_13710 [bacterium]|nr:hypothetical protein [bacterium]